MPRLIDMLTVPELDLKAVTAHLDELKPDQRLQEVREIPGAQQKRLFAAALGWRALTLEHYVPRTHPEREFVRHQGKNSLPIFSHFEKRFARPDSQSPVLWGFNHGPAMAVIGPGHFVLRNGPGDGELHVDYYSIPTEQLVGAPPLQANDKGVSNLVYGNMIDVLRGISEHVSVGRAIKHGQETSNYFLLCREA